MNDAAELAREVARIPLEELDPGQASPFRDDSWRPYFERPRREAPVHRLAESANGPFWSVRRWDLVQEVDTTHGVFSSADGISIVDPPEHAREAERRARSCISMDPPEHGPQRTTVQGAVAPRTLTKLEPRIRERALGLPEHLPVGEPFDRGDRVSLELTARRLATLFDVPYEDRRKLIHWSDATTRVPS